jgi:uncharacterized protein
VRVKIDLSQLDQGSLEFKRDLELAAEDLANPLVESAMQIHLEGTVRLHDRSYLVTGWISCSAELQCSRCLEPVPWQAREQLSLEYQLMQEIAVAEEIDLDEDELDIAFLEEEKIDIEELAIEQVELALPMRVVCQEQCAGLCPTCGGNRNRESECRCEPEVDPRWQTLRGLKGNKTPE